MKMCPHCGRLFRDTQGAAHLIPQHREMTYPSGKILANACPGSLQAPRNHASDRRPLWNGQPNPHIEAVKP